MSGLAFLKALNSFFENAIETARADERAKIRERVEREIYYLANESEGDITGEIMGLRRALMLIDRDGDT